MRLSLIGRLAVTFWLAWNSSLVLRCDLVRGDELAVAIDRLVAKQGITNDGPGLAIAISQPGVLSLKKATA